MFMRCLARLGLVMVALTAIVGGQSHRPLAPTPPMGWNSWDAYGLRVTEAEFRANVDVLASVLKPYGWRYAVIDEGWFMENPEDRPHPEKLRLLIDGYGRYIPVPARFPSAAETHGFEAIGRDVHALGLKFGIHIVRGIPRVAVAANTPVEGSVFHAVDVADQSDACPWDPTNWGIRDNAAGQAYYDSLLHQYAGWGVDILKVDCISNNPYKKSEIVMLHRAIEKTGRPIVLSLSPGPTALDKAAEIGSLSQMWRISNDIWDLWKSAGGFPETVTSQFPRAAAWAKYAKPGNWPDADMLPFGQLRPSPDVGKPRVTRLTQDEQKTQMTLWAMARSPLILGANLTLLDGFTTSLLVNRELIRIDQAATASREVSHTGDLVVWTADLPAGAHALALFNLGDGMATVNEQLSAYGLGKRKFQTREAWGGEFLGSIDALHDVVLPPHGCALFVLRSGSPGQIDLLGETE